MRSFTSRWAFACVALNACTTNFTGYHLESDESAGGASASGGKEQVLGESAANGGRSTGGQSDGGDGGESRERGSSGASDTGAAGAAGSDAVDSPLPRSCIGLASTCGADQATSCCASTSLPGGSYNRSNRVEAPATLSAFVLDAYEISVGRFRNFLAVYSQNMTAAGAGKNPNNLGLDPGWDAAWNDKLPTNANALSTALQCESGTFTAAAGTNENLPVTCINWYEAFAFCVWDGGRLPTEAEWNYAAAGGAEERAYPWGTAVPNDSYAVFCPGSCGKMQRVGSRAPGNGKWGQSDLVGNAWEWALDVFVNPYPQTSCVNCANTAATSASLRVFRGASSGNEASYLLSATRNSRAPSDHNGFIGARCARNPPAP